MRTYKEKVFVLTAVPYRDSDLVVTFLSKSFGKLTTLIYGGRKIGKTSSFLYHSGDLIELEYEKKESKEFITTQSTFAVRLQQVDKFPYERFVFQTYLVDLISRTSKPELSAEEAYELLLDNHDIIWTKQNYLPFVLWSIWVLIKSGGYQINHSVCNSCSRESWKRNENQEVAFRKEKYWLNKEKGVLICNTCLPGSRTDQPLTASMIKILWMFESRTHFDKQFYDFPTETTKPLIHILNSYLLMCFEIQPKSLDSFLEMISA